MEATVLLLSETAVKLISTKINEPKTSYAAIATATKPIELSSERNEIGEHHKPTLWQ